MKLREKARQVMVKGLENIISNIKSDAVVMTYCSKCGKLIGQERVTNKKEMKTLWKYGTKHEADGYTIFYRKDEICKECIEQSIEELDIEEIEIIDEGGVDQW